MVTTATPSSAYLFNVTETTQTQTTPPGGGTKPHRPEYRLAADALRGLRQDLFHDAFACRPLPRRRTDGPLARRLPEGLREYAGWAPHGAVVAAGWLVAGPQGPDTGGGVRVRGEAGCTGLSPRGPWRVRYLWSGRGRPS